MGRKVQADAGRGRFTTGEACLKACSGTPQGCSIPSSAEPGAAGSSRRAVAFSRPIVQPVTTAEVATDDFGILDALDELLEDRSVSGSDLIAEEMASSTLSSVNAAARDVREGDAIVEAERFLDGLEVKFSTLNRPPTRLRILAGC